MQTRYGIPFPKEAISVRVSEVDVDENGGIRADFDFAVNRAHPAFWLYCVKLAIAIGKVACIDFRSVAGLASVAQAARNIFDFYAPENRGNDDDDDDLPPTVSPAVTMSEVPAVAGLALAARDISPRWFLPAPCIVK